MSLKKKAAQVRAKGSKNVGEDSVLAHISPKEAMLLKMRGGSGQPDPETGLPHFAEGGGGFGDGGADVGDGGGGFDSGGGWADAGGFTGAGLGSMGGYQGYDPGTPNAGPAPGGWAGLGFGDLADNGFGFNMADYGFNAAMDSQQANTDLGLGPVTSYDGTPDLGALADPGISMSDIARRGLGMLPGPLGMATKGYQAATSKDPGKGFGNIAGSTLGGILGSFAGPAGMALGSQLGGYLGGKGLSGTGASAADSAAGIAAGREAGNSGQTSTDFDLGGVLTGLAGLYQGGKASNTTNQAANVAQQQTQTLADLYGPNSPYAAQLRQQLERKDAAAGRRSQYGPREVELQARLADIASRNAPNVLNANKQAYEMNQAGNKVGGQQLASVLNLANKTGLTGYAQKGLSGLFDGWGSGGGTTGSGGFSMDGQTYNNPSAYEAPSSLMPGESGGIPDGGNFWDSWL